MASVKTQCTFNSQPDTDYCVIPLSHGLFAKVSKEDYAMVAGLPWFAKRTRSTSPWYACLSKYNPETGKNIHVRMHRMIMKALPGETIDHRDRDGLNNQRTNLRRATSSRNASNRPKNSNNRSGHKGVSWCKDRGKWIAQIVVDGKHHHIGRFESKNDAAIAYKERAEYLLEDFYPDIDSEIAT